MSAYEDFVQPRPITVVPAVGEYQTIATPANYSSTLMSTADRVFAYPMFVGGKFTVDQAAVYLATAQAGAAARVGIYKWNKGLCVGAALLQDCGEIDLSAGSGLKAGTAIEFVLQNAPYWVLVYVKGTNPACTVMANSANGHAGMIPYASAMGAAIARAYFGTDAYPGAAPSVIPSLVPNAGISPIVFFHRSA